MRDGGDDGEDGDGDEDDAGDEVDDGFAAERYDALGDCMSNEVSNSISSNGDTSCALEAEFDLILAVVRRVVVVHHEASEKYASNDKDGGSTQGKKERCDDAVW